MKIIWIFSKLCKNCSRQNSLSLVSLRKRNHQLKKKKTTHKLNLATDRFHLVCVVVRPCNNTSNKSDDGLFLPLPSGSHTGEKSTETEEKSNYKNKRCGKQ